MNKVFVRNVNGSESTGRRAIRMILLSFVENRHGTSTLYEMDALMAQTWTFAQDNSNPNVRKGPT